jgi:hypothetical protein
VGKIGLTVQLDTRREGWECLFWVRVSRKPWGPLFPSRMFPASPVSTLCDSNYLASGYVRKKKTNRLFRFWVRTPHFPLGMGARASTASKAESPGGKTRTGRKPTSGSWPAGCLVPAAPFG